MKNKIIKLMVIVIAIIVILDQMSKIMITKFLNESIGNEFLKLEITTNTGMAFGFNDGNIKNILLSFFVIGIILSFVRNQLERIDNKTAVAVAMALGGGISNLIDRFFRGGVLDFIKIYKFAIINLADVFVVLGWILIIIFLIDFSKKTEVEIEKKS